MNERLSIELSLDLESIVKSKKRIVAAMNATFFSEVINKIPAELLSKKFIFWPDGLFAFFVSCNFKKIPGRKLLKNVLEVSKKSNQKVIFIGDKFDDKIDLLKDINWELRNVSYGSSDEIFQEINENLEGIVIINIPSPKQEELAVLLSEKNPETQFFCTGGALNMLLGEEKIVPEIINKIGLEWLWRLRNDTKRRIKRLMTILFFLPRGIQKFGKIFYHEK
tara:strand:+ start:146 stop:811 length:666 start_codon:yes stop_codon:yes gene_type:complete